MTCSHLLKLVVILTLAGTVSVRAADPATNAPAVASNVVVDAQAVIAKEMKEAKKKARQAGRDAKEAKKKAEQDAKKAAKEAKKADREALKKAKEQAAAEATNPPPAVAEAPAAATTNLPPEPPKKELKKEKEEKPPWRVRLHDTWKRWTKETSAPTAATNVETQAQAPAEPVKAAEEKPAETNVPAAKPSEEVVPLEKPTEPGLSYREKMSARWEEGEYDWVVGLNYILPSDSEYWQNAYALDLEAQRWLGEDFGVSAVLGYGMWNVNDDADPLGDKDEVNPATISGSADTISLGLGGLYRIPLADQYQLILDAGLKYVMLQSDITIRFDYQGHFGDVHVASPVYVGDRIAGWVGATVAGTVEDEAGIRVQLGVGYQFDLTRESENWLYQDVANNLNALVVRLSVGF